MNTSRLSAVGTMASGIAHEINNPLAIISAAAEQLGGLIRTEHPDREQIDKVTGAIARNVTRIHRIVRGLRALSRDGSDDPSPRCPSEA